MKKTLKLLPVLILCALANLFFVSRVQAQVTTKYNTPQAPNFDFEVWDDPEPWGWNSSSCYEVGNNPSREKRNQSVWSSNEVRPGSPGVYSVYIKVTQSSWYRFKVPFGTTSYEQMGTLTTGTLYYYNSKDNANSFIYTNIGNGSKRWEFTGHPDSVVFWAKWSRSERPADMTLYLHRNEYFADCNPNGVKKSNSSIPTAIISPSMQSTTPIGSANQKITRGNGGWVRYSVPIAYESDETPAYLLLSFTAGNNFREVVEGDELWVDDVEFIYNPVLSIDTAEYLEMAHHGSSGLSFELPYTFYSGTADPIDPAAQNELRFYLSDEDGNFIKAGLLTSVQVDGGDNIRHTGRARIDLPADLPDSDKYRIRIEASNYDLQSNIIHLSIYSRWYLTVNPAGRYGSTEAKNRVPCRHNSQQSAHAEAGPDCRFLRWEENGKTVSTEADYTFSITSDRDLTAVFDTTYTLRFAEAVGAYAYFDDTTGIRRQEITLLHGQTARLRADIDEGYLFMGFELGGTVISRQASYDYRDVMRGGTIYVRTDSIPYDFEFSAWPEAKLGEVSGSGTYKHFGTVTARAESNDPRYSTFLHWEDADGGMVGTENPLRIENISGGGSYRAVFEETFHRVHLSVNDPVGGSALQCGQRKADSSYSAFDLTEVSLRAVPARGFGFRYWKVERDGMPQRDTAANPYYLTRKSHMDADYSAEAVFGILDYALTLAAENGGAEGAGSYPYGTEVRLVALPDKGHHVARWESGRKTIGTQDTLVLKVLNDTSVRLVCEPNLYRVDISVNDGTLGGVNLSGGLYGYGSELGLTALPAPGAELRYWVIDGDSLGTEPDYLLEVEDSCRVMAVFSHARSHVALHATNDTYGKTSGAGTYEWHSPVTIAAEAFEGYRFEGWRTPQGDTVAQATLRIDGIEGDTVLTALFAPQRFRVELKPAGEGFGSVFVGEPAAGQTSASFDYMEYARIEAVPAPGSEFAGWFAGGDGMAGSAYPQEDFPVWRDTVLYARFEPLRHAVSLFVSPLGVGEAEGAGRYREDETARVRVEAFEGYEFMGWYEADTLFSPALDFTLENLREDRYLTAKFREKTFLVSVRADDTARADSCLGQGMYRYAYNANVYVYAKTGYEVAAWVDGKGDTLSRLNPYLHDVFEESTLTAVMRPKRLYPSFAVWPDDAGRVRCGEVYYDSAARATAHPAHGYGFSHWEDGNGDRVGDDPALTFVTRSDTNFKAVFKPLSLKINGVSRRPERGWMTGGGSYEYLSTCTLTIGHNANYHFTGWYDGKDSMLSRQHTWTFIVTDSMDVFADFEPLPVTARISVEPPLGGTVYGDTARYGGMRLEGEVSVPFEDSIRFRAVPARGMRFRMWRHEDVSGESEEWQDEEHTFFPEGGCSVTAVFDTVVYPLSVSVEPPAAGSVRGQGGYKYGRWAEIKAEAGENHRFHAYMSGDEVISYSPECTFRVDSAMEIRAVFLPEDYMVYALPADVRQGQALGTGRYAYGTQAAMEAFAWNDSLAFAYWSASADGRDTLSENGSYGHPVGGSDTLHAFFKPALRTLRVKAQGGGTVRGDGLYEYGRTARAEAQAAPGHHFAAWKEYGVEIGRDAEISLAMRSDRTLEAVFEPDVFRLRLESRGIDVALHGAGEYAFGSEANIRTDICPEGYVFSAWRNERGETVSSDPDFSLRVSGNTVLYAEWNGIRHRVELWEEGGGKVSGGGEYGHGDSVRLAAVPDPGRRFAAWYRNGRVFSGEDSLVFRVRAPLELTAVFGEDIYPVSPISNMGGRGEIEVKEDSATSSTVTLQALPEENHYLKYWTRNDSILGTGAEIETERMQASQVVAHFMPEPCYVKLSSSTPEGLKTLHGSGSFYQGDEAELSVEVRDGYEFLGWFEEGSDTPLSTDPEYTFTVRRDMRIDARAKKQ
ncbi:MAG: hypothetical protein NC324_03280 [Bacteroides sp.]|nr:hypothetical protein [Bacteroides sp.]